MSLAFLTRRTGRALFDVAAIYQRQAGFTREIPEELRSGRPATILFNVRTGCSIPHCGEG
jgi:hypothetical protein